MCIEGQIIDRREMKISQWVRIAEKEVCFDPRQPSEIYHSIILHDYVTMVARTPSGMLPIVRQFRPAVEEYTLELPSGLLDSSETPEATCRRELLEETGLEARSVVSLGQYFTDTGRLENRLHLFAVETHEPNGDMLCEAGIEVEFVTLKRLKELIVSGKFAHPMHVAAVLLDELRRNEK